MKTQIVRESIRKKTFNYINIFYVNKDKIFSLSLFIREGRASFIFIPKLDNKIFFPDEINIKIGK